MPWTRHQVKFLLSSGSPLSGTQKRKMVGELHRDPSMGHKRKGYSKLGSLRGKNGKAHSSNAQGYSD